MTLAPEELSDWKHHPVTEKFLELLKERRAEMSEYVVKGGTLGGTEAAIALARIVGTVDAIDDIVSLEVFVNHDEELTDEA